MRAREAWPHAVVPADMLLAIRLDGNKFSGWTSKLPRRPGEAFNVDFAQAMVDTARALVHHFAASLGYTHSDEITLVFPPKKANDASRGEPLHAYGGKVQKLVSLTAAYASMVFNERMQGHVDDAQARECERDVLHFATRGKWFDARVIVFPADEAPDISNYFIWRQRDCTRNCVHTYFCRFVGKRRADGLNTAQRRAVLEQDAQVQLPHGEDPLMIGTFVKRVAVLRACERATEPVLRHELRTMTRRAVFGREFYEVNQ